MAVVAKNEVLLIESKMRFTYPLALELITIPTERWPRAINQQETTAEHDSESKTKVVFTCFGRETTEYHRAFVTQWVATLIEQMNNNKNKQEFAAIDEYTSETTLGATRLFYESEKSVNDETCETCLSMITTLGTMRVREEIQDRTKKFAEYTQNLRVLIMDMKQCEQLLRIGIRSLAAPEGVQNETGFDEEIAWKEAITLSVENNLKRFIAFTSALLTRKWSAIRKIQKLNKRRQEFEQASAEKAESVESTIANEIYKRVNEHLTTERSTITRLNRQIFTMRRLLNNTRKVLTQVYSHLYAEWNGINSSLRRTKEMLRNYQVSPPNIVQEIILRDEYTSELLKSYEILRNCNTLILKLADDTYDQTYESLLPRADRSSLQIWSSVPTSDRGLEELLEGEEENSPKENKENSVQLLQSSALIEACEAATHELLTAINAARRHYTNREWDSSPLDIRRLALAFYRVLDTRVRWYTFQNRDNLLDDPPRDLNISSEETDQLVLARMRQLEKTHITLFEQNNKKTKKKKLRLLGDNIIALRDTQDAFDLSFFTQLLEYRLDRMLHYRFPTNSINSDKTIELMYDERIVEELERATRENFSQLSDEWDRLITRIKSIERNSTKTTGLVADMNLATRIEQWHYRTVDPFKITLLNARLTQIDEGKEVSTLRKTVSRYTYLLSWMLELRVFVNEPPQQSHTEPNINRERKTNKRKQEEEDDRLTKKSRLDSLSEDEDGGEYLRRLNHKRKRSSSSGSDEIMMSEKKFRTESQDDSTGSEDGLESRNRKRKRNDSSDEEENPNKREKIEQVNSGAELKRLQRIAELSPSLLNVRLLNDIMEKEQRKQDQLFENIDNNLRNLQYLLNSNIPLTQDTTTRRSDSATPTVQTTKPDENRTGLQTDTKTDTKGSMKADTTSLKSSNSSQL